MAEPHVELLEAGTVPAESVARRLVELDRRSSDASHPGVTRHRCRIEWDTKKDDR